MPVGVPGNVLGADQRGSIVVEGSSGGRQTTSTAVAASSEPRSSAVSSTGGSRGDLNSTTGPATISVNNTTDLNALAEAVTLAALGENVAVSNSTITRSAGTGGVVIDLGTLHERTLSLTNTTLSADVIKARSFATDGRDALIVSGSSLNASTLIRLYADGQSTLRFKGDVKLNAPQSDLAAQKVTIDSGSSVTASGNVRVFTDQADFDRPGRGSLNASGTKTVQAHGNRPARF